MKSAERKKHTAKARLHCIMQFAKAAGAVPGNASAKTTSRAASGNPSAVAAQACPRVQQAFYEDKGASDTFHSELGGRGVESRCKCTCTGL